MRIVYLAVLLMLVGRTILASSTPQSITHERLRQLDAVLDQFKLEHKRLPSEAEGLEKVRKYLFSENALQDAWGHPFVYRLSSTNDGRVIYSVGKDGRSATDGNDPDDINLWDPYQKWRDHYHSHPIQIKIVIGALSVWLLVLVAIAARRRWKLSQNDS